MKLADVIKFSTLLLLSLPLCFSQQNSISIASASNKGSAAGATVGVTVGTTALGTAGYFIYRYIKRERLHGDSVIAFVNNSIDLSNVDFSKDEYLICQEKLQRILPRWNIYERYRNKRKLPVILPQDSIVARINICQFLNSVLDTIRNCDSLGSLLPNTEEEIFKVKRHSVIPIIQTVQNGITQMERNNPQYTDAIHHGFRAALQRINVVDSLYKIVYAPAQLEFSMKCKFHFNRAIESRDTIVVRHFVEDCEYYNIKKEWYDRARKILLSPEELTPPIQKAIIIERKPAKRSKR
jgi:hypothetical protein